MARPYKPVQPVQAEYEQNVHTFEDWNKSAPQPKTMSRLIELQNLMFGTVILKNSALLHGRMRPDSLVYVEEENRLFLGCWKWTRLEHVKLLDARTPNPLQKFVDKTTDKLLRNVCDEDCTFLAPVFFYASTQFESNPRTVLHAVARNYMFLILHLKDSITHSVQSTGRNDFTQAEYDVLLRVFEVLSQMSKLAVDIQRNLLPEKARIDASWIAANNAFGTGVCCLLLAVDTCVRRPSVEPHSDPEVLGCVLELLNKVLQPMLTCDPRPVEELVCTFKNTVETFVTLRNKRRWSTCISTT